MKRKINISVFYPTQTGMSLVVQDNTEVYMSMLARQDFVLIDKNSNIIDIASSTEDPPGHYQIVFARQDAYKIRIKKYGYSTRFKRINLKTKIKYYE